MTFTGNMAKGQTLPEHKYRESTLHAELTGDPRKLTLSPERMATWISTYLVAKYFLMCMSLSTWVTNRVFAFLRSVVFCLLPTGGR